MKFNYFLDYLFPRKCFGCGTEDSYLCSSCSSEIKLLKRQCCPRCRRYEEEGKPCSKRCAEEFIFDELLVCLEYAKSNLISKMVVQFKYKFSEDLVGILGKIMKHQLAGFSHKFRNSSGNIIFIPVPLSERRLKFRGFNQSLLLAKYLKDSFNDTEIYDCMNREDGSEQQAGRARNQRLKNLENKIFVKENWNERLRNKNVVLIDDIATTGTTLNECARALKTAGVNKVCGLVLARGK